MVFICLLLNLCFVLWLGVVCSLCILLLCYDVIFDFIFGSLIGLFYGFGWTFVFVELYVLLPLCFCLFYDFVCFVLDFMLVSLMFVGYSVLFCFSLHLRLLFSIGCVVYRRLMIFIAVLVVVITLKSFALLVGLF